MKAIFLSVKTLTVQGESSVIAVFVILLLAGCTHPDRTYFTIEPRDRKIVIPVQINDSIEAKLAFDTGAWLGTLDLDSSFCATHSSLTYRKQLYQKVGSGGSAWAENHARKLLYYNVDCGIKIGNNTLKYNELTVLDWKGHMGTSSSEGLFNIPENDTTHVWELNFESNYV